VWLGLAGPRAARRAATSRQAWPEPEGARRSWRRRWRPEKLGAGVGVGASWRRSRRRLKDKAASAPTAGFTGKGGHVEGHYRGGRREGPRARRRLRADPGGTGFGVSGSAGWQVVIGAEGGVAGRLRPFRGALPANERRDRGNGPG